MQKTEIPCSKQSRLPSLRFTMRTYCRTPVEKERFDLSVRQVLRKSRSATLSTAYRMVFLFSRSLCQRKIWMLAVYAVKNTWHQGKYGLDYKCKKGCEKLNRVFHIPLFSCHILHFLRQIMHIFSFLIITDISLLISLRLLQLPVLSPRRL